MKSSLLCPNCGHRLNAHINFDNPDKHPGAGDICICAECERISVFDEGGKTLHLPTEQEIAEFKKDEEFWNEIHEYIYFAKEVNDKKP